MRVLPAALLTNKFPNLSPDNHTVTSPQDPRYNCVAWATGDSSKWWQPMGRYWPVPRPAVENLGSYVQMFESRGFEVCPTSDQETGFEKIAIYAEMGAFKHVARMNTDGSWTSKLGESYDITHTLEALTGPTYGWPTVYMKKKV